MPLLGAPLASLVARLVTVSPRKWTGRTADEWAESLGGFEVSEMARMGIGVSTYVADFETMPADLAISQLKMGFAGGGVSYLHGGWGALVEGLWSAASAAGATIRAHRAAAGIHAGPGGWEVQLADGEVLRAAAVVVAVGGPAAAAKLLPNDPGWTDMARPVTAACLDLGLRDCRPPLVFGLDEPLYLSRHSPPGDLAPPGGSVVHVMRYGARDGQTDRAELRSYAHLAGVDEDDIVEERFLAETVVTHLLPTPEQGLAGRPGVSVPGAEGIYLAGDWVGPCGWLADAAVASGQSAGLLASRAPQVRRAYPRVP